MVNMLRAIERGYMESNGIYVYQQNCGEIDFIQVKDRKWKKSVTGKQTNERMKEKKWYQRLISG